MSDLTLIIKHGYRIIIAGDRTRNQAAQLVKTRYAWRGYSTSFCESTDGDITLCAKKNEAVIATVSLRTRNPGKPLLCETSFKDEVAEIYRRFEEGGKAAEITRLAAEPNHIQVIATLLHVIVLYSVKNGVTNLIAEINPRHVKLYQECFGFRIIGDVRECARTEAPAVLVRTNPSDLIALISRSNCVKSNKHKGIIVYKLEPQEVTKLLDFFESQRAQMPY